MMRIKREWLSIIVFCSVLYTVTLILNGINLLLKHPKVAGFSLITYQMLLPGLCALYFIIREHRWSEIKFSFGRTSFMVMAVVWPLAISLLSILVLKLHLKERMEFQMGAISLSNFLSWLPFVLLLALGEEMGWRGYLLERLRALGIIISIVIVGFVWTFWHFSLHYSILKIYFPEESFITSFLFQYWPTVTALSFVLAYLYWAGRSIWYPTLFHGIYDLRIDLLGLDQLLEDAHSFQVIESMFWIASAVVVYIILKKQERNGSLLSHL